MTPGARGERPGLLKAPPLYSPIVERDSHREIGCAAKLSRSLLGRVRIDGSTALALATAPGDQPTGEILRIDLGTGQILETFASVAGGTGLALSADGAWAYVISRQTGSFDAIDISGSTSPPAIVSIATGLDYPRSAVFVFNTADGADVSIELTDATTGAAPVTLTFASIDVPGDSQLEITSTAPSVPTGFQLGTPETYYEVTTTATFSGTVEICIDYSGISYAGEATLQLLHYENGQWTNVTTQRDPANDIICAIPQYRTRFTFTYLVRYLPSGRRRAVRSRRDEQRTRPR